MWMLGSVLIYKKIKSLKEMINRRDKLSKEQKKKMEKLIFRPVINIY